MGGKAGAAGQLSGGENFSYDLQMKSPNRDVSAKLKLSAVPAFNANLFADGWAGAKAATRPAWIEPDAWDQMWPGFAARLGSNSEEFLNNLRTSAEWLEARGAPSRELGDVLGVALRQARGRVSPIPLLAASTDLRVQAPEFDLSLTRYASASVEGRAKRGPLGRGWALEYDWKLEDSSNGAKTLVLPNGTLRGFVPLRANVWQEVGGGAARLEDLNGTMTLFEVDGVKHRFLSGRLWKSEGRFGSTVTVERSQGRIDRVSHSNGASIDFQYDFISGRLVGATDTTGRSVSYRYDLVNADAYLAGVTVPGGRAYQMEYIPAGNGAASHGLSRIGMPDGTQRLFEYEGGQIKRLSLTAGARPVTFSYEGGFGNVQASNAAGGRRSMAVGRGSVPLSSETLGAGSSRMSYNALGDLTGLVTARGNWSGTYDARGNLLESRDRRGVARGAAFSENFNTLQWARDGRKNTHRQVLSTQGLPTQFVYPDGSYEQFSYDSLGQVTERINRRAQNVRYAYNTAGQITNVTIPGDRTIVFSYDTRQRLVRADCTRTGWIQNTYDNRDFLTRVDYQGGRWVRYEYDDAGKRTRMESSDGQVLQYTYDATGSLKQVRTGDGVGQLLVEYTYDAAGRVLQEVRSNDTRTEYQYNPAGFVTRIRHLAGATLQAEYVYTHDEAGLPLTAQTPEGLWRYTYDAEHQLVKFIRPNGDVVDIDYDAEGNRIRVRVNGVATEYGTDNQNRYFSVGGRQLGYDLDGNLTGTFTADHQPVVNEYDALGRLVRRQTSSGIATFEYDALGNLTGMTENGVTRRFLLDGNRPIAEFGSDNQLLRRYWYANGLLGQQTSDQAQFFGYDMTGHTRLVTSANGSLVGQASYDPFGQVLQTQGQLDSEFLFCGRLGQRTLPGGGVLMGSRVYDPLLGRFQQLDPIRLNSDSLNLYRYAANSPLAYVDPTGTTPVCATVTTEMWLTPGGYIPQPGTVDDRANTQLAHEHVVCFGPDGSIGANIGFGNNGLFLKPPDQMNILSVTGGPYTAEETLYAVRRLAPMSQSMWALSFDAYSFVGWNCQDWAQRFRQYVEEHRLQQLLDYLREQQDPDGGDPGNGGPLDDHDMEFLNSWDPNEKAGAVGAGPERWVKPDEEFVYTVYFENLPTARAHAQEVFITDVLDSKLDLATLELREVNISGETYTNLTGFQEGIFRAPFKDTGLVAEVRATFNIGTRTLRWELRSLDPLTNDLPPEVDRGLLPPNNAAREGEGYVRFVIKPRSANAEGVTINNQARIVFDTNAPIDTNIWSNRLDMRPPVSRVRPHTGIRISPTRAVIEWSGSDGPGSGVATYDVYVREVGGLWERWQKGVSTTRAVFTGQRGKTYEFYSIATDRVGRREEVKSLPESRLRF